MRSRLKSPTFQVEIPPPAPPSPVTSPTSDQRWRPKTTSNALIGASTSSTQKSIKSNPLQGQLRPRRQLNKAAQPALSSLDPWAAPRPLRMRRSTNYRVRRFQFSWSAAFAPTTKDSGGSGTTRCRVTGSACLLNRWAPHRSVGAEHAAVPSFRLKPHAAARALVKNPARVNWHRLSLRHATVRTGDNGLSDHEDLMPATKHSSIFVPRAFAGTCAPMNPVQLTTTEAATDTCALSQAKSIPAYV